MTVIMYTQMPKECITKCQRMRERFTWNKSQILSTKFRTRVNVVEESFLKKL